MSWWRRLFGEDEEAPAADPLEAVRREDLAALVLELRNDSPGQRVESLRRLRERFPDAPAPLLELARAGVDESEALWTQLSQHAEHRAEALAALAEVADDPADRARAIQQALALDPGDVERLDQALRTRSALPAMPAAAGATLLPVALPGGSVHERTPADLTLGARLGAGGFGVVYAATDPLGRDLAVKFLHPHHQANPGRRADFIREAATLAGLDHPGLVDVFDVDARNHSMTMRRYRGSLASRLSAGAAYAQPEGLCAAVARTLADLHGVGQVHGDLKPANILFAADGRPVLADLGMGIAQQGTAGWQSPEQAAGAPPDPAADVFALGRLLQTLEVDAPLVADCLRDAPADRPTAADVSRALATLKG